MPLTANLIWRDFETDGVPASGAHKPIKSDIRGWGTALEAIGGLNAPGADTSAALFSAGTGAAPVWRKIVGFDLPNPSTQVPGAVFAKPAPVGGGQILAGLGIDGEFDLAEVSGSGNIVLSDNPNFTGTVKINGLNFLSSSGGTHNVIAPDGRLGFQMQGSPSVNFYKATTHQWYDPVGSLQFAQLDQVGLQISPAPLTGTTPNIQNALKVTATWNNGATVNNLLFLTVTDTASGGGSRIIRADVSSHPGSPLVWFVDKNGSGTYAGNLNIGGVIVIGAQNFATFNGSNMDRNNVPFGTRYLNNVGAKVLEIWNNDGSRDYYGSASGSHKVSAPAAAAGASTWPTTTGVLLNTGAGMPSEGFLVPVNFNAVGDAQIPIVLPQGFTRYRLVSGNVINTGPGAASLTAAQYGIFTGPGATGTAIIAAGATLTAITTNSPGTTAAMAAIAFGSFGTAFFELATTPNLYFRTTTAQGAAALGQVLIAIQPIP